MPWSMGEQKWGQSLKAPISGRAEIVKVHYKLQVIPDCIIH